MSGLAEKNVRTSRKISGLALFKSASPMDYQSIKSAVHPVTPGLWELITMKKPDVYDDEDYDNYTEIMINTNALKRGNDGESRTPKSNKSWKWNNLLKPIWAKRGKYEGTGVVILPSDAEALLDRLELLMASKGSGNTGLGNEIVSICDELKRQNVLDVNQYKNLMSSL